MQHSFCFIINWRFLVWTEIQVSLHSILNSVKSLLRSSSSLEFPMAMGCEWILLEHLTHHTGSISSSEPLDVQKWTSDFHLFSEGKFWYLLWLIRNLYFRLRQWETNTWLWVGYQQDAQNMPSILQIWLWTWLTLYKKWMLKGGRCRWPYVMVSIFRPEIPCPLD